MNIKLNKSIIIGLILGLCLLVIQLCFNKPQTSNSVPKQQTYTTNVDSIHNQTPKMLSSIEQPKNKGVANHNNEPAKPVSLAKLIYIFNESSPEKSASLLGSHTFDNQFALTLSLVKNWSLITPDAALDWLQTQTNKFSQSEYQILLRALLKNYAVQEPEFVFYQFKELATEQLWNELIYDISLGWAHKNVYEAWHWLAELEQQDIAKSTQNGAYVAVMEAYLKADPITAAQLIMDSKNNQIKTQLIPKTALALATIDLQTALNWAESLHNKSWQKAAKSALDTI